MSAQIRISVERGGVIISTNVNQSVDNVRKGDVVYCESVDVHTTYSWTLVFTPDSPNGTVSSSGLINPPGSTANNCKFVVDNEGAYLVRLVVDAGLGTESTQFLRIRKITRFGDLKLVAAGERKDSVGAIPYDIDPVGWADDQNQNLQKLLAYVRRLSTSGRVLYVDANRGRKAYDSTQNANDFTNTLEMPGADLSALTTSGVVTDAEGFADFSDISSAITYATDCASRGETALSSDHPYVILVQNGLYIEDVNLAPNIHIVSADNFFTTDNTYAKGVVIRSTNVTGGHTFVGTNNTDRVICVGVEFENTDGASTNPTFKVQKGIAHFVNCTISQKSGTGGSALSIIPVDHTTTDECQAHLMNSYVQNTVTSATDYAIKCGSDNARLVIENSTVVGQNGIQCNADYGGGLKEDVHLHIVRSTIMANNVNGYAIFSNASDLQVSYSYVSSSDTTRVLVIGENLPKTGDVVAKLIFSEFSNAQISFDTRQIAGSKTLQTSSCIYSGYVFPDAPPTHNAETQAKSLKYENNYADPFNSGTLAVPVPNQLGATDVQDALDDLTFLSAILGAFGTFNSLDVAYDGVISVNPPTLGSGSGRRIAADQGAVVIQSAVAPYVTTPISGTETTPLTSADKNGYLQVEGNLEVGKVDSGEIELISNYGTIGSMLSLGSVTWNSEIASVASGVDHRSLPSAILQGNSDKNGLLHNYNLRLQTKSTKSVSNGSVGWVVLQGGDSLDKGPSAPGPHAGDVYIQGGSYLGTGSESVGTNCPAGSVYLIPGTSTGIGSDEPYGYVKLINPSASTSATLLASATCSNPTTVAGEISWATPMGVVTATITIGMTPADVVDAINNATVGAGLIVAQVSSGTIALTCASKGELSDVVYVGDNDSGNINTDLGDFQISSGATFAAGTDPQYVNIHSSALHEITIGEGGTVGSMIYNSDTGKLTVPGLIDPTGMIFSEENQNNVPTGANEGAIFVSDGTDGLIANKIYYKPENNGTPVDLTAGGGGGGLTNWSEDASGHLYPNSTNTQNLGSTTNVIQNLYLKDDTGITFTNGTNTVTLDVNDISGAPTLQFNGVDVSGGGGGSTFTNWSEDIAKNLVTSATNHIGSPSSGIGNIYLAPTKSVHWTDASDQIWSISPTITTSTAGDPNIITFLTKNTLSNPTQIGEGISYHYQLKNVAGNIGVLGFHNILVADSGTNLSGGYSGMQEFWVAENVVANKYLTLDGRNTSVIFNKVPTLYKDTTVNLNAYSNLVDGMIAYDTTTNNFVGYSTGSWINLSGGGSSSGGSYGSSTNPLTYVVTVAVKTTAHPYYGMPSIPSNAYFLDGVESPAIRLRGADSSKPYYYRFDQSDASNTGHQINFYLTADNTGVAYTTGVTTNGIAGNPGAYIQIAVDEDTPNILYYQCTVHQYMGNHFTTISNTFNDSGTLVTVSSLGGGGGGGATDKIEEGDTKVEVADTGSNGVIIFETEGSEKWRIRTAGHLVPQGVTGTLDIGQTNSRVSDIYSSSSKYHYVDSLGATQYTGLSADGVGLLEGRLTQVSSGGTVTVLAVHSDTLADFGSTTFFDTHLIPTTNGTLDIGTATNKVRDLYLSDSSLKFVNSSNTEFAMGLNGNNDLTFNAGKVAKSSVASDLPSFSSFKTNETSTSYPGVVFSSITEVRKDIEIYSGGVLQQTQTATANTPPTLRLTVSDNGQGSTHWTVMVQAYDIDGVTLATQPSGGIVLRKTLLPISSPTYDLEIPYDVSGVTSTLPALMISMKVKITIFGTDSAFNPTGGLDSNGFPNEYVTFDYDFNSRRPQVLDIVGEQAYFGDVIASKIIVETDDTYQMPSIVFKKNSDFSRSKLSLVSEYGSYIEQFGFFSDEPYGYNDGATYPSVGFANGSLVEFGMKNLFSVVSREDTTQAIKSPSREGDVVFSENSKWVEFGGGVFHFENHNLISSLDSNIPLSIQANDTTPTYHQLVIHTNRVGINIPNDESNSADKVRDFWPAQLPNACLEIYSEATLHPTTNLLLVSEDDPFTSTTKSVIDFGLKNTPTSSLLDTGRIEANPSDLRGTQIINNTIFSYSQLAFSVRSSGVLAEHMTLDVNRLTVNGGVHIGDYSAGAPDYTSDSDNGLIVYDSSDKLKLFRSRQFQEILPEVQSDFVTGMDFSYGASGGGGITALSILPQRYDDYAAYDTEFSAVTGSASGYWENGTGQTVRIVDVEVFFYITSPNSLSVATNIISDITSVGITLSTPTNIGSSTTPSSSFNSLNTVHSITQTANTTNASNIAHNSRLKVSVTFNKPNTDKKPIKILGMRVTYTYDTL